ncbi:MAG: ferritin-like domain-containing protein [Roseiarcus sp.]
MGKSGNGDLEKADRSTAFAGLMTKAGRREFLRGLGFGAAGAATLGAAGLASTTPAKAANIDAEILTFALNLEYLEAEFYSLAASGKKLPANEIGPNPGPTTGGSRVPFLFPQVQALANELQTEETKHVLFLQAALSAATGSYVSKPAIDFQSSFPKLALAAGLGTGFNPFTSDTNFLLGSFVFEDVGVTAYHGAAPLITSSVYLDKAAGILAAEAYHAGAVRMLLFNFGMASETMKIANLRATLDGTINTTNIDDGGVGDFGMPRIALLSNQLNGNTLLGGFPSNSPPGNNAIAFDRTTRQVLNIVYGAVNASSGLFFPDGLNGPIH